MAPVASMLTTAAFIGLLQPAAGNAFLKKQESAQTQFMNQTAIEMRFLKEVRGFVGKGPLDAQLPEIQAALEPMWLALPKNSQGRLNNAQVRYALHRFFVQRHGWHIDGLDRMATDVGSEGVSRQQVPSFLLELFDEAFGQSGLMLHELSLFAATLEHLIHDEAADRLKEVYQVLTYGTDGTITTQDVDEAAKAYLMSLMLGQDKLGSSASLIKGFGKLERTYPGWKHTQEWLQGVRSDVLTSEGSEGYSFNQVENYVQEVSHRLGSFQDTECKELKSLLLQAEDGNTGRVKLSDFYRKGMETAMQFVEKPEYLRQLGALDESLPGEPRVIVPNYILSQGNCLADMGFYSICCINECEALMGALERDVAASEATPEALAKAVSKFNTSTVEAGRTLTSTMTRRLEAVADRNGGKVPLHSRLFAQWMHFAFPRECPFPHTAGTTNPLTASEWMEVNEAKPNLQLKEMHEYIQNVEDLQSASEESTGVGAASSEDEEALLTRWSEEEEILYLPSQTKSSSAGTYLRVGVSLSMMAAVGVAVVDQVKRSGPGSKALIKLGISEKSHLV